MESGKWKVESACADVPPLGSQACRPLAKTAYRHQIFSDEAMQGTNADDVAQSQALFIGALFIGKVPQALHPKGLTALNERLRPVQ